MSNEVNNDAEKANKQTAQKPVSTEVSGAINADGASVAESNAPAKTPTVENTNAVAEAKTPGDTTGGENQNEMDFGALFAQYEKEHVGFSAGETVKGIVAKISETGMLVDFGHKSEGIVAPEEYTNSDGEFSVKLGDEVEVVIRQMSGDRPPILSYFDAKNRLEWDAIEAAFEDDTIIKGVIKSKTKGGLRVMVNGVEAFLPGSQVDSMPVRDLDPYIGKEIEMKVVKFNRKRNNIVLSRKVITDEAVYEKKRETLAKIEEGYVVDGVVKNLTEYGAFVDIGGIDGLLHVTDMSWGRLRRPGDMLKVEDSVQIKVLKLDKEKGKVSLGYKQLFPDPWSTVRELFPVESKVKGRVSSVTEYGAFVELKPGVEGLIHVSEMSWAKRMKHPKQFVSVDDHIEVQVLGMDLRDRRISLGMKQLQENPWDSVGERYQLGSRVHGKVRNLTDFGAFVEIEDGIDGLVHISDISWSKTIKHPKDVLSRGQEVDAIITKIDPREHRLSLSIKELTPSTWANYTSEHRTGDIVKGKITRFAGFGVFVELAPDLEGLCHISELSDSRTENAEDDFEIGQELEFKILRVEDEVEKIGLSLRAVSGTNESSAPDKTGKDKTGKDKTYSSEAKGGMASLGELANLKFGGGGDKTAGEPDGEPGENAEVLVEEKADAEESSKSEKPDDSKDGGEKEEPSEVRLADEKKAKREKKVTKKKPAKKAVEKKESKTKAKTTKITAKAAPKKKVASKKKSEVDKIENSVESEEKKPAKKTAKPKKDSKEV